MLGELPSISGNVCRVFTTAAYCDQQSWLVNDTIQNIIGESNFSSTWYESVIHACDLDQRFARLPQGDYSVIGSRGITLSGGQKQRVMSGRT
jgi:ATP-binding cassette subfamily C (CFTR/MRP) protein 1